MIVPTPPSLSLAMSDLPRSGLDIFRLTTRLSGLVREAKQGDGHPVLTLPGYGGGDASMLAMRHFFNRIGYNSFALGLGINFEPEEDRIRCIEDACAFREKMADKVQQRVDEIYQQTGEPVTLVGWSMGGLYAFDVAQQSPQQVRQLITLGSPFGDPRGTSMFNLMRTINRSDVPVEEQDFSLWSDKAVIKTRDVPMKIVFSQADGFVAPQIAMLADHDCVEHIEISAAHAGFTHNPRVFSLLAELLSES